MRKSGRGGGRGETRNILREAIEMRDNERLVSAKKTHGTRDGAKDSIVA